ncbi:MAG TPA: ABC transporter ATP-binding protein [Smithellaceae bacterium]|nr:ABC transporter ATP-binding protein [Smithellaceae bacterium]HRS89990.1 ABC transporter ATP-binding protein [Smithellaceae bacterium]HRV26049.1 ABC transporter ATP-binding protein [Smithellaceae bacterium]
MQIVSAQDVNFSYGENTVIRGVSFSVGRSEITAIIGPNGSGKTTLLKLINGTLLPEKGEVGVAGKNTARYTRREIAKKVSIVPQETSLIFPYYAEEIVLMGRFPHLGNYRFENKNDYSIVHEAMERTDTLSFARRRFNELSAGERQRVLIARALAQEPEVLLLDESTAFLDLKHQLRFLRLLKKLKAEKQLTIVFVTHDINLAAQHADKIILLYSGKIYAIGNPAEVISARNMKEVYEVDVLVDVGLQNRSPRITLLT